MFKVYESGKLARFPECKVYESWDNCSFSTFQDALEYAQNWLGEYGDVLPNNWNGSIFNYMGECSIEIREEV